MSSITAEEYLSRFGARGGRSTWLTCPECGQPVVTRAMTRHSVVSPYFKHEDGNHIAWKCPSYRAGGDQGGESESVHLGEPVDMFLERTSYDGYAFQAGFPPIEPWALEYLHERDAVIYFGDRSFAVDSTHFGNSYAIFPYEVEGPSFGLGLKLEGTDWPYDTPLSNIEHALNGCMLFEALDEGNFAERLTSDSLDLYDSEYFLLVYSTIDGIETASLVQSISDWFKVKGSIDGSWEGEDELRVASFRTGKRDALKAIFA